MKRVSLQEAHAQLSRLVDEAANGDGFVIAKDGKPLKVVAVEDAQKPKRRVGFLDGKFPRPDDFDSLHALTRTSPPNLKDPFDRILIARGIREEMICARQIARSRRMAHRV
ncbi:Antitoxin component of toxin-antitoxin stability system, DNA-binding transcriptional repressor [Rhizobium sp. RU35A]|uniref:type II toxin-antitoxin system Phd/YefM family antitoxin n=1 Tax=Rhizobium sp. RU35A TaxID=1907414 RepID=UPI000955727E|nr:Antitoxin component of toxin-antitoxin stability system, DNA-binding transcriptional repressor [Rhizobium sp. RU35A]